METQRNNRSLQALYLQWKQVMILLTAALNSRNIETGADSFTAEMWETQKDMLMGDAYQIAVKIKSSESGNMYLIRMENVSMTRKNAQFIKSSMLPFIAETAIEKKIMAYLYEKKLISFGNSLCIGFLPF